MKKIIALSIIGLTAFALVRFFDVEPTIEAMAVAITGLIGSASLICASLVKLTKITPTTKDDELVKGARAYLAYLLTVLDLLAFNLTLPPIKKGHKSD